ncbi:hypothetical protein FFF93_002700 [Arthrobacter sp. KBS0702]|uniref:hypothetical protein n=1 Tax=Arthrobacter sp. KBS0702 TaxID=2578107 RepID=UPI00110E9816|nr:hypothetical protein [Arthrobacter sp. KBS0702]QDW28818.1 hypothetical protein FFF93_002700 [Arthrobacter sp. KBS0702]
MTITAGTYRPDGAHQPRGRQPWCASCHSDRHLLAGSVAVLDARQKTLALAITCTRCGESRVMATTAAFAAAVMGRAETGGTDGTADR